MNPTSVLLWGFLATLALTTIQSGAQAARLTRMSLPLMLGTMFTGHWERARVWGFAVHFLNGWLFSLVYALVFESWGHASWWEGGLLGLGHGLFVLVVLVPLLPSVHPRMATEARQPVATALLEPPGALAMNYGVRTPMVTLFAHVVYGMILGAFYVLAA
jgi:hypothetical protein